MRIALFFLAVAVWVSNAFAHDEDSNAGPLSGEKLGTVHFSTSCNESVAAQFDRGMAMFHSFWFDPAAQAFSEVAQADPRCAMAHWGIAMTRLGNPFAWPPSDKQFAAGRAALAKARESGGKTMREVGYIEALGRFYDDPQKADVRTRAVAFRDALEVLVERYPDDAEAQILYALLLDATALPSDKTFTQQLQAAAILEKLAQQQPDHPGIVHYLIHSYDYPPIAAKGLDAARRYANVAPSAPHALHMPAHIFTRLGYWDDSIETNRLSAEAAKAELGQRSLSQGSYNALHAMDYMVYAYLQQGRDAKAKELIEQMSAITQMDVENFPAAYAFAAAPARYALERADWAGAAHLEPVPKTLSWDKFPQAAAITVFARALGCARSGDVVQARAGIERLGALKEALINAKQPFWADQVALQIEIVKAWTAYALGDSRAALEQMRLAADHEDATDKHPVTPGPLAPARELYGEMLLLSEQPAAALFEFQRSQEKEPNRLRGYYGAAQAAERAGREEIARANYEKLSTLTQRADSARPEIAPAGTQISPGSR
jgi:hypothetical protein